MLLQELKPIEREQWIELIRTASVGRLIFTEQALPAVQLVDFRWWRGDVVIRITDASVLSAVSRNRVVAFETDELDPDLDHGWSVTVVGRFTVITEVPDLIELSGMFSRPSVGGRRDYFVRIRTEKVSGRRLAPELVPAVASGPVAASTTMASGAPRQMSSSPAEHEMHGS